MNLPPLSRRYAPVFVTISFVVLVAAGILALGVGAVRIAPSTVIDILLQRAGPEITEAQRVVIWNVRLPRVLLALIAGAGLATTGVLMQALFRNPLADPALIGVSAGAALGAVAVIVLGATALQGASRLLGVWTLPAAAFLGALGTALVVFRLSNRDGMLEPTTMLLCGIAVNALSGAGIGMLTYLATDDQLRNLTFWSLGSLGGATWGSLLGTLPACLFLLLAIPAVTAALNALLLGESEAHHLGVRVERIKRMVVAMTAAAAGSIVAVSGVIGFVGLVCPHLARLLVGPNHRYVFPLAAALGASILTIGDMLARTVVSPAELPIGILTALLGAPFFLWLLRRQHVH